VGIALQAVSHSEKETSVLAEKLALFFRPGDVIVLTGELGAGKTVFARGLARGFGIKEELVNSPSFTIVNEYPGGKLPFFHLDLYRLGDESELREVGWDDYCRQDGVMVVEWGERAGALLPERYYRVAFKLINEQDRDIDVSYVES